MNRNTGLKWVNLLFLHKRSILEVLQDPEYGVDYTFAMYEYLKALEKFPKTSRVCIADFEQIFI